MDCTTPAPSSCAPGPRSHESRWPPHPRHTPAAGRGRSFADDVRRPDVRMQGRAELQIHGQLGIGLERGGGFAFAAVRAQGGGRDLQGRRSAEHFRRIVVGQVGDRADQHGDSSLAGSDRCAARTLIDSTPVGPERVFSACAHGPVVEHEVHLEDRTERLDLDQGAWTSATLAVRPSLVVPMLGPRAATLRASGGRVGEIAVACSTGPRVQCGTIVGKRTTRSKP